MFNNSDLQPDIYAEQMDIISKSNSPFEKSYWIARAFISYENGGFGNDLRKLNAVLQSVNMSLNISNFKLDLAKKSVKEVINSTHKEGSIIARKVEKLADEIDNLIESVDDFRVLEFTIKHILIPTTILIEKIPSDDREFALQVVSTYLREEGINALSDVIEMWDRHGMRGSLLIEREAIVAGFSILRTTIESGLQTSEKNIKTRLDADLLLTTFVQEFERRLVRGKRPQRSGRSLEDVTGVILNHFEIPNFNDAPEHIKTVFEVDKLITLPNGWRIGVSCKRTLRERWKQSITLDEKLLDENKIYSTWHVLTHTGDLSVDKIQAIGELRSIIYVPDDSYFYKENLANHAIRNCLRPMSKFIDDIRNTIRNESD